MDPLDFRVFCEADRPAVIQLWEACDLVRQRVVATVMAGYDGHRGWINYLAVDPHDQGSGIGNRLMAEAERLLAELGCAKVNLQIRRSNAGVAAFYGRLGYVSDDAISMGKRLLDDGS